MLVINSRHGERGYARTMAQLTFPQDVVPRRHYKKTTLAAPHCGKAGHGTLRASGSEPAATAGPRE